MVTFFFYQDSQSRLTINSLPTDLPIVDDDTDEADKQYFIAHLRVFDAMNEDLIVLKRAVTKCVIVDDDSEFGIGVAPRGYCMLTLLQ